METNGSKNSAIEEQPDYETEQDKSASLLIGNIKGNLFMDFLHTNTGNTVTKSVGCILLLDFIPYAKCIDRCSKCLP